MTDLKPGATKENATAPYANAMTGLALLTFLAHGETPNSDEFGPVVEKAIKYLLSTQTADGHWESSYTHAICTYAMCEAFALTRIPMVKTAAEKGLSIIIRGQNTRGGWDYPITPTERSDTSVMGWCAQAVKAGKMAGIKPPGLEDCVKKAVEGFQYNSSPGGGFGYATVAKDKPGTIGASGLSGVGVLCMQLLGASRKPECKRGLEFLGTGKTERFPCVWNEKLAWNAIYYWYYITQAKFHAGDDAGWDEWNREFATELVKNQVVKRGEGLNGKDAGYWMAATSQGPTMDTTLCALQLQVYYRYLPTYKTPQETDDNTDLAAGADEVQVDVKL